MNPTCLWHRLERRSPRHAGIGAMLLLLLLIRGAAAQTNLPPGILSVSRISGTGAGCNGVVDSVTFSFGYFEGISGPTHEIFQQLLTIHDVGKVFTVTSEDDPDFGFLVSILTNGTSDNVGDRITAGLCGFTESSYEARFFSPLPQGGNNVDFAGFHIDNIALEVEELTFKTTGNWTDLGWNLTLFVNSEPWSAPVIWLPPQDQTVDLGTSAEFKVGAAGASSLVYQWFFNGTNLLANATNSRLVLPGVQLSDDGMYAVVVSNAQGATTSSPVRLKVQAYPPTIVVGPASQRADLGGTASFNVTVTGSPWLAYQWFFDGNAITGATATSLDLGNLQLSQSGAYTVVITNAFGAITSSPAALTVVALPPTIIVSPLNQTAHPGESVEFWVSASGSRPLTYQWSFDGLYLAGATTSRLQLDNVQFSQAGSYAVIISNAFGSVTSAPVTLTLTLTQGFRNLDFEQASLVPLGGTYSGEVESQAALPGWSVYTQVPFVLYDNMFLDSAGAALLDEKQAGFTPYQGRFTVVLEGGFSLSWPLERLSTAIAQTGTIPESAKTMLFDASLMHLGVGQFEVRVADENLPYYGLESHSNYNVFGVDIARFAGREAEVRFIAYPQPAPGLAINIAILDDIRFSSSPLAFAPTILSPPQNCAVVEGGNAQFAVMASGLPEPAYQWFFNGTNLIDGATHSLLVITNVQFSDYGAYTVMVSNSAGVVVTPAAYLVADPAILVQPRDQTVDAQQVASFQVQVLGSETVGFQWLKNGTDLSDGGNLLGTQTPNLTLERALGGDAGRYSVRVTNAHGVVTSRIATLTVRDPVITLDPVSRWVGAGTTVSFSTSAAGSSPLSYQWSFNGRPIDGATGRSLVFTNVSVSLSGTYMVVVTNQFGAANSQPAVLGVFPEPAYTVLHSFSGAEGRAPHGKLASWGNALYGTAQYSVNHGAVFKLNMDGTGFVVLHDFKGPDGSDPIGGLAVSGDNLYGATETGGALTDPGTLFSVRLEGSEFSTLKDFATGGGRWPAGDLVLSGTTLYGVTSVGGNSGCGNVFKMNVDGSGYAVLHDFTGYPNDGYAPWGGLALSGTTLYGATVRGGAYARPIGSIDAGSGCGTLFRLNTDGSGYIILRQFSPADGGSPSGGLLLFESTLYGLTDGGYGTGGSYTPGIVFRINTDGSGFKVLHTFAGYPGDGAMPYGTLTLKGSALLGTTSAGGSQGYFPERSDYGYGTVFRINTDGSGYSIIKEFTGDDGAHPFAGLLVDQTAMYGTCTSGGASNNGVIFALALPLPSAAVLPLSQTAEAGTVASFEAGTGADPSLNYQWVFNETNILSEATTLPGFSLTNVQFSQAGAYSVIVRNDVGAVTSPPALLSVIPRTERRFVPGLTLKGPAGSTINLEATGSVAPFNWAPFDSVLLTSNAQWYFDVFSVPGSQRFYRAWQAGISVEAPGLDLHNIPALTLRGTIGSVMRVDCINRFGPVDAWFAVATVTLTNTSQLYFDVTAPGATPRLWRLVPQPGDAR